MLTFDQFKALFSQPFAYHCPISGVGVKILPKGYLDLEGNPDENPVLHGWKQIPPQAVANCLPGTYSLDGNAPCYGPCYGYTGRGAGVPASTYEAASIENGLFITVLRKVLVSMAHGKAPKWDGVRDFAYHCRSTSQAFPNTAGWLGQKLLCILPLGVPNALHGDGHPFFRSDDPDIIREGCPSFSTISLLMSNWERSLKEVITYWDEREWTFGDFMGSFQSFDPICPYQIAFRREDFPIYLEGAKRLGLPYEFQGHGNQVQCLNLLGLP